MRQAFFSSAAVAALTAAASFSPAAVQAQDGDQAGEGNDVIVVTARRKDETLLETPVSVAAFDEEAIENLGIRSIDDLARHTAGLSFSQAFGRTTERPVIRGAANILAGVQFGVESGTAYFIDGVYYSGDLQALDTRNLARAEVIKGPQSALYGRNTYAGAINYISRLPSKGGRELSFDATYAEDGEFEVYGRASTSLMDDTVGVSISARYYEYDGDSFWVNQDGGAQLGGEQSWSINFLTDFAPSENFSAIVRLGYVEDNDGPRPFAALGAEQNNCYPGYRSGAYYNPNHLAFLNPPFGGIFPDTVTTDSNYQYFCGSLSDFDDLRPAQSLFGAPFMGVEREMFFGTAKTDWEFADGYNLLMQLGFRTEDRTTGADSDHQAGEAQLPGGGPFVFPISPFFSIPQSNGLFSFSDLDKTTDFNVEVRLRSPLENRLRWSLGAFYFNFDQDEFPIDFGNAAPSFLGGRDARERIENTAVFGTLAYDLTEQIEVSFEGRYQTERKALTEFDGSGGIDFDGEERFKDFIPKVIVNYTPAANTTIYASWAEGLKPGGINGPDGLEVNQVQYLPENANAFEVGFKTQYAGGRGVFTIAGYYNDITNYQLTTPVASAGQVNSVATNQGDVEVLGVEVETSFDLTDALTIGGTYAWTDAEFTEGCDSFQFTLTSGGFVMAPITPGDPSTFNQFANPDPMDPTQPVNDPDGLFTGAADCSIVGNKVPMTSEHQFSTFGSFEQPISSDWSFFTNVDYTFESSKFIQVHNGTETGDVGILGAQMGLRNDNIRVEIFARNLTDNRTPPIATRWFDFYEGFRTLSTADQVGIDASVLGPRTPFLSFRRGRQIGGRISVDF